MSDRPGFYDTVSPTGGVSKGDGVVVGDGIFGVACHDAAQTLPLQLLRMGVAELAVATAVDVSEGDLVYWDVADAELNATASGNFHVGAAAADAGVGVVLVDVLLDGVVRAVGA